MYAASAPKVTLTDEQVIELYALSRPNYCFELLYKRYSQKVYRRCLSMTKDPELAQDYAHDVFIRVMSRLDKFQGRSSFSTWLYTITNNYVLDQLRLSKRMSVSELNEGYDYPGFSSDDRTDTGEAVLQQLGRAMGRISSQDAQILRLKYEDELDVRQICDRLNLNDSAVKMRLKRSRDRVRHLCEAALA